MEDSNAPEEREEELSSIAAIFPELQIDENDPYTARLELSVELASPLKACFPSTTDGAPPTALPTPPSSENDGQAGAARKDIETNDLEIHQLLYLPPLQLEIVLPSGYPDNEPPYFSVTATGDWLPQDKLKSLEDEGAKLWEEYGRSQVVFGYIDFLQQAAERAFDLAKDDAIAKIAAGQKIALLEYDRRAKRRKFEAGTYDCGVCLDPKKGSACYQMSRCGHIFCIDCLKDFYNSCISEGDVTNVRCMDPSCGKVPGAPRAKRKQRTLSPNELLQIPLDHTMVKRYVELKRKKKIEADKTTIYCPRKWCQGPARSTKYPKITSFDNYVDSDSETEDSAPAPPPLSQDPSKIDRLAVCEDCEFAFCRVCLAGWHGDFVRCWPRTAAELSEDEQASYNYIRANTSPCPTCNSPVQKSLGCNHMTCFQCRTHFCYLCSSWLDSSNPYAHFNKPGTDCFQRLWELEEGDNGQGAHFNGPRALEIAAIEALQADLQDEAEAIADADGRAPPEGGRAREEAEAFAAALNDVHIQNQPPAAAPVIPPAANNRVPAAARAQGQAQAVAGAQHPPRRGVNEGLLRFIAMAQNDEEDDWDSDELDDDDEEFANLA